MIIGVDSVGAGGTSAPPIITKGAMPPIIGRRIFENIKTSEIMKFLIVVLLNYVYL